jgi:hypothetical protein
MIRDDHRKPLARYGAIRARSLAACSAELHHQPGHDLREHWVMAVSWEDEASRMRALEVLSQQYQRAFAQYERFEPEILILRSHTP